MSTQTKVAENAVTGNQPTTAFMDQEPGIVATQEPTTVSGPTMPKKPPRSRVAGPKKRKKRQPKSRSIFDKPLVLAAAGLVAIYLIGVWQHSSRLCSIERPMLPPLPDFPDEDQIDSGITGWSSPVQY